MKVEGFNRHGKWRKLTKKDSEFKEFKFAGGTVMAKSQEEANKKIKKMYS